MLAILAMAPMPTPQLPVEVAEPWLWLLLSPWSGLLAFVWGTLWGSFANVVIYRVPRGQSVVRPGSRCPACGVPIAGFDNVPVLSYLLLRGRCRRCKAKFSPRYLLVELLGGLLSFATFMAAVTVPLLAGGAPGVLAWQLHFALCMALLVVVFVDLDLWIIPDAIVLPMAVVGVAVSLLAPDVLGVSWQAAIGSALGGWGSFVAIRWLYLRVRGIEALGLGDAKLLLMVGAWCGPVGLAWCIGAGAIQGLLVAVPMLWLGKSIANSDLHEVHGHEGLVASPAPTPSSPSDADDGGDPTAHHGPDHGPDDPAPHAADAADAADAAEDPADAADDDPADPDVLRTHVPFGPFLGVAALEYVLLSDRIDALLQALLT